MCNVTYVLGLKNFEPRDLTKTTQLWGIIIPSLALTTISKKGFRISRKYSTEWFFFRLPADEALVDVRASVLGVALVSLCALGAGLGPRPVAVRLAALVARRAQQLLLVLVRVVVALAAPAKGATWQVRNLGFIFKMP